MAGVSAQLMTTQGLSPLWSKIQLPVQIVALLLLAVAGALIVIELWPSDYLGLPTPKEDADWIEKLGAAGENAAVVLDSVLKYKLSSAIDRVEHNKKINERKAGLLHWAFKLLAAALALVLGNLLCLAANQLAVFSRERILDRLNRKIDKRGSLVISPLLQARKAFDADSVDLRLGTHFLLPRVPPRPYFYPGIEASKLGHQRLHVPLGRYLVVPAHETVLGATPEFIKLPSDVSGEILTKSSVARMFVVIETAPMEYADHEYREAPDTDGQQRKAIVFLFADSDGTSSGV